MQGELGGHANSFGRLYLCYTASVMSEYYNSKRTKYLFDPKSKYPFRLSRSKVELFLNCPRCFYMDRRLGIGQPPGFPFNLNSAVDHLLKKEFDIHRAKSTAHPLMKTYGIDAVPLAHAQLNVWRDTFKGVEFLHKPTNFTVFGGVDDVWINPKGELMVVDYKATSKDGEVSLDAAWQDSYKNQMEIYQWLFRQNGFKVSKTGYFVYCNGKRDREAFDGKLEFDVKIIPYEGDDSWVEKALLAARKCLDGELPDYGKNCDYCAYRQAAAEVEAVKFAAKAPKATIKTKRGKKSAPAKTASLFD